MRVHSNTWEFHVPRRVLKAGFELLHWLTVHAQNVIEHPDVNKNFRGGEMAFDAQNNQALDFIQFHTPKLLCTLLLIWAWLTCIGMDPLTGGGQMRTDDWFSLYINHKWIFHEWGNQNNNGLYHFLLPYSFDENLKGIKKIKCCKTSHEIMRFQHLIWKTKSTKIYNCNVSINFAAMTARLKDPRKLASYLLKMTWWHIFGWASLLM